MNQDELKRRVADAALAHIEPLLKPDTIVGVGTGSTANFFIDGLAAIRHKFDAAVASSEVSSARLQAGGVPVLALTAAPEVAVYVDGADEVNAAGEMIKGGGGALTREKIVASAADTFVCIVDESKQVDVLGNYPLPVEVIPMARSVVARALVALGGAPELREGFTTDNGNLILDVHGLHISEPRALEREINDIAGVVCCGIFARHKANTVIIAESSGNIVVRNTP